MRFCIGPCKNATHALHFYYMYNNRVIDMDNYLQIASVLEVYCLNEFDEMQAKQ